MYKILKERKYLILGIAILAVLLMIIFFRKTGEETIPAAKIDEISDRRGLGYPGQRKIVSNSGGEFFVAYRKKYEGKFEIFVAKAVFQKGSWQITGTKEPISLVGFETDQRVPSIAIDKNSVLHIVWYGSNKEDQPGNRQIKYSQSKDGGKTWSSWTNISEVEGYSEEEDYWQEHPYVLAGRDGNLYVVWEGKDPENDQQQIKFSKSQDQGRTWNQWKDVQPSKENTQSRPLILDDNNGRLHLLMYSSLGDSKEQQIQYSFSDNQGEGWSEWKPISNTNYDSRHVSAAMDEKNVLHAVWRSGTEKGVSQIYYSKLENEKWREPSAVSLSDNYQFFPSIGLDKNRQAHVSWMESASGSGFPRESPEEGMVMETFLEDDSFLPAKTVESSENVFYPNFAIKTEDNLPIVFLRQSGEDSYSVFLQILK